MRKLKYYIIESSVISPELVEAYSKIHAVSQFATNFLSNFYNIEYTVEVSLHKENSRTYRYKVYKDKEKNIEIKRDIQ